MNYQAKIRPLALKLYYFFVTRPYDYEPSDVYSFDTESEFTELFLQHSGRTCDKWHHYLPIYDQLFNSFCQDPIRVLKSKSAIKFLELGVFKGGSLQLWRKYFGSEAVIHGVDIDPRCSELSSDDLPVHIGSQSDPKFLNTVVNEMGGIDVVLDDGSHRAKHQRVSFRTLFPLLADGGLYIIEDTHTSYWFAYGGGFKRPGTAIELGKKLVDDMHGWYHRFPSKYRTLAQFEISSIQFFDSIIVIKKGKRTKPVKSTRGTDPFLK